MNRLQTCHFPNFPEALKCYSVSQPCRELKMQDFSKNFPAQVPMLFKHHSLCMRGPHIISPALGRLIPRICWRWRLFVSKQQSSGERSRWLVKPIRNKFLHHVKTIGHHDPDLTFFFSFVLYIRQNICHVIGLLYLN